MLGFPFLKEFNPNINWETGGITLTNYIQVTPLQTWEHQCKVWKLDKKLLSKTDFARKVSFAQQWAAAADKAKDHLQKADILIQYQKHQKVFFEEGAK